MRLNDLIFLCFENSNIIIYPEINISKDIDADFIGLLLYRILHSNSLLTHAIISTKMRTYFHKQFKPHILWLPLKHWHISIEMYAFINTC